MGGAPDQCVRTWGAVIGRRVNGSEGAIVAVQCQQRGASRGLVDFVGRAAFRVRGYVLLGVNLRVFGCEV